MQDSIQRVPRCGRSAVAPASRSAVARHRFSIVLLGVCLLSGVIASPSRLFAAEEPPAGRVLFIVETSKAMRKELPAAAKSIQQLLQSGMEGKLRPGDTIGLWTYDSDLRSGSFPLQVWTDRNSALVGQLILQFLHDQKPKGKGDPAEFVPDMLKLFAASDSLTVFIYSSGNQPIEGTPFDDSINEVFRQHSDELTAAQIPFVTVLAGRKGRIVNVAVNAATGVSLPPVTDDVPAPKAPAAVSPPKTTTSVTPATKTAVPTPFTKAAPFSTQTPLRNGPAKVNASIIVDYSQSNRVQTAASPETGTVSGVVSNAPTIVATSEGIVTNAEVDGVRVVQAPEAVATPPAAAVATPIVPVPAPEINPPVESMVAKPVPAPFVPASAVVEHAPLAPPPAVVITQVPVPVAPDAGHRNPLIWFLAGLGAALLLMMFIWKVMSGGSSRSTGGSLITKSFDRDRK